MEKVVKAAIAPEGFSLYFFWNAVTIVPDRVGGNTKFYANVFYKFLTTPKISFDNVNQWTIKKNGLRE